MSDRIRVVHSAYILGSCFQEVLGGSQVGRIE